jgi:hypothetical protein
VQDVGQLKRESGLVELQLRRLEAAVSGGGSDGMHGSRRDRTVRRHVLECRVLRKRSKHCSQSSVADRFELQIQSFGFRLVVVEQGNL